MEFIQNNNIYLDYLPDELIYIMITYLPNDKNITKLSNEYLNLYNKYVLNVIQGYEFVFHLYEPNSFRLYSDLNVNSISSFLFNPYNTYKNLTYNLNDVKLPIYFSQQYTYEYERVSRISFKGHIELKLIFIYTTIKNGVTIYKLIKQDGKVNKGTSNLNKWIKIINDIEEPSTPFNEPFDSKLDIIESSNWKTIWDNLDKRNRRNLLHQNGLFIY